MLKTFKKILCSLLVVVMCLTSAPLQGFIGIEWPGLPEINFGELFVNKATAKEVASSGSCGNNVTYTYNSSTGELIISGTGAMKDYSGTSPFQGTSIKSVVIERGVTSVGDYAFYNCSNLASVTLPAGITIIGFNAFAECSSLSYIKLPDSLKTIESYAFSRCSNLNNILIPNGVTMIKASAFELCTSLTEFIFPDSMTDIYGGLFVYCYGLTSVTIPKSITSINEYAFRHCNGLTDIYYLGSEYDWNTINIIEDNNVIDNATIHFAEASHVHTVEEVTIPSTCSSNGMQYDICTFCGEILSDITLLPTLSHTPGEWEVVWSETHGTEVKEVIKCIVCDYTMDARVVSTLGKCGENLAWTFDINTGVLEIIGSGEMSSYGFPNNIPWFAYKSYIKKVILPIGLTSVCGYAFYESPNLVSVEIPNTVLLIEHNAFTGCTSLENLIVPAGVLSIETGAFADCTKLKSIAIPNSVSTIGDRAFNGCTSLESITISDSVEFIGEGAFTDTEYYINDANWENDLLYIGNYLIKAKTTISGAYEIKEGTRCIANGTFRRCGNLESVIIPDSVVSINDYAFHSCTGLKELTMPVSAKIQNTYFDSVTFYGCTNIELITLTKGTGIMTGYSSSYWYTPWYISSNSLKNLTIESGVKNISDYAFYDCDGITEIIIPESVELIGEYAFYDCDGITDMTIPDRVTSIPEHTFQYCSSLESVIIGNGITSIGEEAFYGSGLTNITIPASVKNIGLNAFCGCENLTDVYAKDVKSWLEISFNDSCSNPMYYAKNLYFNNILVTEIIIPNSITSIGYMAFYNCESLESISIPDSITFIDEYAFYNCINLKELTMPVSAKIYNDDDTFYGCANLETITFTKGTGTMCDYGTDTSPLSLVACYWFTPWYKSRNNQLNITIEEGVLNIGEYAFYKCSGLSSITIPDSVVSIDENAFADCKKLEKITIGKGLTTIEKNAFYNCDSIDTLNIGSNIKSIDTRAFYGCTNLTDVYVKNTLSWLGIDFSGEESNPLYYASNLYINNVLATEIIIPDGVESIGKYAFYNYTNLKNLIVSDSVTYIDDYAFYCCENLKNITIPASVVLKSTTFSKCNNITDIVISKGTGVMVENSVSSYKYTPWYHSRENDLSITIKSGVKNISAYAFKECTGLKNITIPYSVNHIGDEAFFGCKELEDIYIPRTVKSIGNSAFKSCTKLIDIKIPYGVVDIGEQAFRNCSNIENITISNSVKSIGRETFNGCSKIRTIKLPNNLSSIEPYTFCNCSELVDVTIPKSVVSIDDYAFYSCKNLTDVYYIGSQKEWEKISMGSSTGLSDVTIHYAIDDLDDELSDDVIISTNLKFDKESYEASYSSVLNEGSHEEIKLTFTADINTINTFDKDDICFSILDESIATFDRSMYIKSVSSKENATIYCKLNLHKSGTTIVNAILPDGSTATCTLIVKDDDDWRKDKVKIEFRYADSKEIIDTSHKYQSDEQIKLNFTTERSGQYISSALNGILYLDSIYFPLTSISATWKSKYGEKEYAIKSNETLNARAGDTIVVYMSEIVNNGSVVNKHTNGINDNYGVSKKEDSFEKEFREKAKNFVSLLDEYIALINGSNSSKKKEPTKEMLEKSATELKNSSIVDRIYAIPPKAKFEYALCYALASAFFDKTMENIDLGKIDLDKSKEEIAYNLTKKLISNFDEIETTVVYENYKIYIKLSIVGKAFTGYYHAYNNKNGSLIYGPGLINSNKETTEGTLNAFFMSMADIVRDMLKAAMMSIFKELADVTGLTEFRKELLNETVKNALSFLEKKGFGKVIDILMAGREIYINIKDIASASSDSIVSNLLKNEKSIRNLYDIIFNNSFTSQKAKDEAAKVIISKLESARKEIYNMLYNKLYGIESDEAGIVTKAENWIKANILCPVDVEVYNIYGELIAYIDTLGRHEEHIYYIDDIYIEVQGDEKFIYYPANKFVEFKFYATENGEMTYSLERIENGESINRINYYNVPLVLGCEYTQDIPSNSDFVEMVDQLYLNGDINIYPDELLDGEDETAHIRVMYSATVGGTVSGDIYYPKGDCVTLFAYPEDGYIFNGWYINEKCVSKSEIYRFAAIEDVIIVAKFDKYEKTDIEVDNEVPNLDCIVISEDNLFLDVGQQEVIYYLPIPSKAKTSIQWLSDNSTVATIDENGLVTACSKGETIITAIDIYTGIKVQCKVFVECEDICLLYGHDFSDWYIDKTDTCIVNGIEKRYCLSCNYVEIQDIPSIGHKLSEWYEVTPATCEKSGLEQRDCSECDYSETQEIPATDHDFDGSECKNCDYDKADDCSCKCHKSGIAKFFFKIGLFFQKIFKKNKVCKCGVYHY